MGHIESAPPLNDWQREHIAVLRYGLSCLRLYHQQYARDIHREYEKKEGHSWYSMRSFTALCNYNAACVKDLERMQQDHSDAFSLAIVGSVQYGVAIPGISDIDGVILYSPHVSEDEVSSIRSRTQEISDRYGYTDNLNEYRFRPDTYPTAQILYWPVFTLATQGGELAQRQEDTTVSYFRKLVQIHGEFPDEEGWADEVERYTRYFFSKPKQPAYYAQRLINYIGLKEFADIDDWKKHREELRLAQPSRPFDEEELAQIEQFSQEGYAPNNERIL